MVVVHTRDQTLSQRLEADRLAETCAGSDCMSVSVGPSRTPKPTAPFYLGRGAVAQLSSVIQEADPDRVFVNHMLSGVQQRNLERAWGRPVVDRVGLIIDIFAQRARTREAQLQVELASLDYKASRLVRSLDAASGQRGGFGEGGLTEVVSARERGRSGGSSGGLGGGGGAGETELQLQRRRLRSRIKVLKRQLEDVRRTRATQRAGRQRADRPLCSVVGYTNAGKSSLVSVLSGSYVEAEDRLFQTLDPTLRQAVLPSGQQVILSDTVGFIDALPPTLIKAFRATLEEVTEADVLIHVMDGSSPEMLQQRQAVLHILRQLGISEERLQRQLIEVVNKADLLADSAQLEGAAELEPSGASSVDTLLLDSSRGHTWVPQL
ncbi:g2192 [Coccomyxa viridis]|uniref:G2192 protein n=1 Tax=Coccomyxa viridis TaxID=1274662 RepID=A0ABP1FJT0_9CHLO